jgi:hypothetical protein
MEKKKKKKKKGNWDGMRAMPHLDGPVPRVIAI